MVVFTFFSIFSFFENMVEFCCPASVPAVKLWRNVTFFPLSKQPAQNFYTIMVDEN